MNDNYQHVVEQAMKVDKFLTSYEEWFFWDSPRTFVMFLIIRE